MKRSAPAVPAGSFITFEGVEGAGKSTQASWLAELLRQGGSEVVETFEPGGTAVGQAIRRVLLDPSHATMDHDVEILLFVADRLQHLNELIRPARAAGKVVICDRFIDSTVAYQGSGRGLDDAGQKVRYLHELLDAHEVPDLTLILDVDVQAGLARLAGGRDRLEGESLSFHERVRQSYLDIAQREPERCRVIDASVDPEKVTEQVYAAVAQRWQGSPAGEGAS